MRIMLAFPMNDNQTGLFIRRAFLELGHEVVIANLNESLNLMPTLLASRPDAIFCSRTVGILPDMIAVRKEFPEIRTACWNVDKRNHVMEFGQPLLQLFDNVDIFYTIALGNVDEYRKACPHTSVRHLQQGCDPATHHGEELTKEDRIKYGCDVMFAGGRTNVHNERVRLMSALSSEKWFMMKQYGLQTNNFITDSEHNKACLCSKIVLGHNGWPKVSISMSVRDYKVMGAGGFLLTEYCPKMEEWYELGRTCESYGTKDECLDKIRYYLEHDDERRRIAEAGKEFVHGKHRYLDRMRIVVEDLAGLTKPECRKEPPVEISPECRKEPPVEISSARRNNAKRHDRLLLGISEGIGNQVQALAFVNFAMMQYPGHRFDVMYMEGMQFKFAEYLFRGADRVDNVVNWTRPPPGPYDGMIICASTTKGKPAGIGCPDITKFRFDGHAQRMKTSEITANLLSVSQPRSGSSFGFTQEEIGRIFDFRKYLVKDEGEPPIEKFDVLLHNGYNRHNKVKGLWAVKEYPHFRRLVEMLKDAGLTVGCVGSGEERIDGCDDHTGRPFEDTINLVDNCRYFISNDTGTYHIRAALGKPGAVIFTAMSHMKNHDKFFHRTIDLVNNDPKCGHHPCQVQPGTFWFTSCRWNQKCRDIDPAILLEKAKGALSK